MSKFSTDTGARARSERGAALVELAVALPLLAVILVGTIDFGRVFRTTMVVTSAARAGAMYGAQSLPNAGNTATAIQRANDVLAENALSTGPSPTASLVCQCADLLGNFTATSPANSCTATCTGGHMVVNASVTVSRTFSMLTPFPGLPSTITITRTATQRAQ